MDRAQLLLELAKVEWKLFDLSTTSYSQSNPYYVLGLRGLKNKKAALLRQLEALPAKK